MDSMNEHLKEIDSQYRVVGVTPSKPIPVDNKNNVCYKEGCGKSATYRTNFACTEKLMCDTHANIFKRKNESLPNDLWYCKKL